jgi:prepilin-type N-terminal cleavage/methylation domain-containing protein
MHLWDYLREDTEMKTRRPPGTHGPSARAAVRGDDRGFSLVEIMIALAILGWVSVTLIGTVTLVDNRNRDAYRWAVAHMAAHHELSYLEACPDFNTPDDLRLFLKQEEVTMWGQKQYVYTTTFTMEDQSYVVLTDPATGDERKTSARVMSGEGRVYVYDLSKIPTAYGGWDYPTADQAFLFRVSVDVDNDKVWHAQLDQVDPDDVTVYSVRVF